MDLEKMREWLIQNGVPAEELDEFVESPIIKEIGEMLTLSLINNDELANMIVALLMEIEELKMRISVLEGDM